MTMLDCREVCVQYDRHRALEDVTFTVQPGDYLCIAGENGSGKSTLLKAILGLVPVQSGRITLGVGRDSIGYLPQQSAIQRDFPASVSEVVLSGCLSEHTRSPFYTQSQKQRARAAMDRLELIPLRRHSYRNLSGGQQQRVLLARALCAANGLLFLDEPVAGLDPMVTQEMYDIIRRLNREEGMTVVMVSHDIPAAVRYATHILQLETKTLFFGHTNEYLNTDAAKRMLHERVKR